MTDKILINRAAYQKALEALIEATPITEKDADMQARAIVGLQEGMAAPQPAQQCWKCGDINQAAQAGCTVPWCGMREASDAPSSSCWCSTCRPQTWDDARMVLCPTCGNKRCPHATDHRNACTGSNEPGQPGSSYPALAAPQPAPASSVEIDGFKTPESGVIGAPQRKPLCRDCADFGPICPIDGKPCDPDAPPAAQAAVPALWQYRWTNPAEDSTAAAQVTVDCPEMIEWKQVAPRLGQNFEEKCAELLSYRYGGKPTYEVRPLYTAPPAQREPLTKDQIAEIAMLNAISDYPSPETLARAIEQAHGIGGNK